MLHQFRLAVRSLALRPALTATVVVGLAGGLGASAAIFNVVDAVLLRALPFADAERLVLVWETVTRESVERRSFSYPDFEDMRSQSGSFETLAAFDQTFFTARGAGRAERITGVIVSRDYFPALRTAPALGIGFDSLEDIGSGGEDGSLEPRVVLSHAFWQGRFGGDRGALGRTLQLDDRVYTVIGVMPEELVPLVDEAQVWVNFEELPKRVLESRSSRWHSVLGRLRDGVSQEQAREELAVIFARLEEQHPTSNLQYGADLGSLAEETYGDLQAPLLTLLVAVGLVLLVTCANVVGLLLVHAARRAPETALRRALGASTRLLLGDRVLETVIAGLAGGLLGIGLAAVLSNVMLRTSPIELPAFVELGFGTRVLSFAAVLSLAVGVSLGIGSVLMRGQGDDMASTLRSGTHRLRARHPWLTALLVTEVALATVLAVGAGLLLDSFDRLLRVDPGFEAGRLLFATVDLPDEAEPSSGRRATLRAQLLEAAAALPSVRAAALATDSPLEGGYSATIISREGSEPQPDQPYAGGVRVYRHLVTPGYFETVGVSLLRGRGFDVTDRDDAPGVAVISRRLAERMWPGKDPLGQRFNFGRPIGSDEVPGEVEWVSVVGVATDHRFRTLVPDADGAPEDPDVYFAMEQFNPGGVVVIAATEGEPTPVIAPLRVGIEGVSPELALFGIESVAERFFRETARSRFASSLIAGFAGVTLFLAALGIWGMVAYQVAARLRDIGIHLALGASRYEVVLGVVLDAGRWLALGVGLGLSIAVFATRWLESQLFEVAALEPRVYLIAALVLLVTGLVAALLPALRAGRVEPVDVLRAEA